MIGDSTRQMRRDLIVEEALEVKLNETRGRLLNNVDLAAELRQTINDSGYSIQPSSRHNPHKLRLRDRLAFRLAFYMLKICGSEPMVMVEVRRGRESRTYETDQL